jgi:hypothetical protein
MVNPVTWRTSSSGGWRQASFGICYMSSVVDSDFFTFTNSM